MAGKSKKQSAKPIRRGLVLSGGGALGAFQAGALKAIRENGIEFQVIAATSIGLIHALAWNRGDFVLSLDERWRRDAALLKPFDAKRILRLKNPFTFRPALDGLFDQYRHDQPPVGAPGHVPVIVSLTEATTGKNVAFAISLPDVPQAVREAACKASTIIPVLGDAPIEIQGKRYYDGGFSNILPIDYVEEMDLDEIWVIALTPPKTKKGWNEPLWRAAIRAQGKSKNPWVLGAAGLAAQIFSPHDLVVSQKKLVVIRPEPRGPFRSFRLIRALTFSPKNIETLLALGYERGRRVCRSYLSAARET